jgi:hypothetical protein
MWSLSLVKLNCPAKARSCRVSQNQRVRLASLVFFYALLAAPSVGEARDLLLVAPGAMSRATSGKYELIRASAERIGREVRVLDLLQYRGIGLAGWTASRELVQVVEAVAKAQRDGFKRIGGAGFSLGGWALLAASSAKVPNSKMRGHLEQALGQYLRPEQAVALLNRFDHANLDRLVVANSVVDVASALRVLFVPSRLTRGLHPPLKRLAEAPFALPLWLLKAGYRVPIPAPGTKIRLTRLHEIDFESLSPALVRDAANLPPLAPAAETQVLAFCAGNDERVPQKPMLELARSNGQITVQQVDGVGHSMGEKVAELLERAIPFLRGEER